MLVRLRHQAWYLPVLALLMSWTLSTLTRIGLAIVAWSNLDHSIGALLSAFARGVLGDLLFATALAGFFLIFTALSHTNKPTARLFKAKRVIAVFALSAFLLFVAVSEFVFWNEFGARFNFVAVDYLIYTNEVIGNIRESYSMPLLLGGMSIAAGLLSLLVFRYWKLEPAKSYGVFPRLGMAALGLGLFFVIGTLSLDYASQPNSLNMANQELSHNGPSSFFLAARENELNFKRYYRTLPSDKFQANAPAWPDLARDQPSAKPLNPEHIVIIQIESMSARFMGSYGSKRNITPHLDKLMQEGVWFSNLYATGTRTVRG
ncbi:MAG: sulfatase-like hydrolase/transferase, partial [Arenimonas sp.]